MRRTLALAIVFLGACGIGACGRRSGLPPGSEAPDAAAPTPSASSAAEAASPPAPAQGDPVEEVLLRGRFSTFVPVDGHPGSFDASLALDRREVAAASATLVLTSAPTVHRRGLALYRLARALGSDVVAPVVLRPVGVGELGELLAGRREVIELVRARAVIQNDGTVDMVLRPPARAAGREISLESYEAAAWARSASSPVPLPSEKSRIVRGYVETLVLDYLSGNVLRRGVWLDDAAGAVRLVESPNAFPLRADAGALDRTLRQLREVARFPRGLDVALRHLDRAGARALFCPGQFETWLLPPRSLVDLDERRAGLLTLIEARVVERGEDSVLSL